MALQADRNPQKQSSRLEQCLYLDITSHDLRPIWTVVSRVVALVIIDSILRPSVNILEPLVDLELWTYVQSGSASTLPVRGRLSTILGYGLCGLK